MSLSRSWSVLLLLAPCVLAAVEPPPPALMVKVQDRSEPLPVSRIEVQAKIHGFLAETRVTLSFANPHDRQLEGDLYFPLPEGSTLSGYALDIQGRMVDGVVVEKAKGRQVFEKIVRQGIDPGLAEWVGGNNFKTRVFPIPARGSRTVMVRYVSELLHTEAGAAYHLPLRFRAPVPQFSVRVEVIRPAARPHVVHSSVPGLEFAPWQEGFVAEASGRDVLLRGDLAIGLPEVHTQSVVVEKSKEGETFFFVHDFPVDPRPQAERETVKRPGRVTILWDASGSRGGSELGPELELLQAYFETLHSIPVHVELVLFRNAAAAPKIFDLSGGGLEELLAELRAVAYDGGTQLGAISPAPGVAAPDLYLLFTDGLSNFGKAEPTGFQAPVYAVSASPEANHAALRALALGTGGEYFNLGRLSPLAAASRIGKPSFAFVSATAAGQAVGEVFPQPGHPLRGRFDLAGKLLGEQATLTLRYGVLGRELASKEFVVSRAQATEGDLLRRAWAQKKLDALLAEPERNKDEILELGKRYGLVTPGTSLIVLDSLEQYVEHEILPPESLPEMREQYGEILEQRQRDLSKEETSKLEHIVGLWRQRVQWWNTKFEVPKDFRWSDKKSKNGGEGAARNGDGPVEGEIEVRAEAPMLDDAEEAERSLPESPRPSAAAELSAPPGNGEGVPPPAPEPAKESEKAGPEPAEEPAIVLQAWNPDTPYLAALRKAAPEARLATYLEQRRQFGGSPAFFLDCADYFFGLKEPELGLQVLSNVAEMELENAALLRILAHRLAQLDRLELSTALFEEVLRLRPEEPQSYRDLALVLARQERYGRAMELLRRVVLDQWDRFEEIELIALMELNNLIPKARAKGIEPVALDARLVQALEVDVRIVITWDADLTDIDLWVLEPTGEKAFYQNTLTTMGGHFSRDFTQGYGPEEYMVRRALHGVYKVQANFYGSQAQTLSGAVTLQADVYTNYGRPNEQRRSITLRLTEKKDTIDVGEIEF
jgi:tetratricopeptide (TPR) repeat protein